MNVWWQVGGKGREGCIVELGIYLGVFWFRASVVRFLDVGVMVEVDMSVLLTHTGVCSGTRNFVLKSPQDPPL